MVKQPNAYQKTSGLLAGTAEGRETRVNRHDRQGALKATLIGFGVALGVAGFGLILETLITGKWIGVLGAACLTGLGLTMIALTAYIGGDDE